MAKIVVHGGGGGVLAETLGAGLQGFAQGMAEGKQNRARDQKMELDRQRSRVQMDEAITRTEARRQQMEMLSQEKALQDSQRAAQSAYDKFKGGLGPRAPDGQAELLLPHPTVNYSAAQLLIIDQLAPAEKAAAYADLEEMRAEADREAQTNDLRSRIGMLEGGGVLLPPGEAPSPYREAANEIANNALAEFEAGESTYSEASRQVDSAMDAAIKAEAAQREYNETAAQVAQAIDKASRDELGNYTGDNALTTFYKGLWEQATAGEDPGKRLSLAAVGAAIRSGPEDTATLYGLGVQDSGKIGRMGGQQEAPAQQPQGQGQPASDQPQQGGALTPTIPEGYAPSSIFTAKPVSRVSPSRTRGPGSPAKDSGATDVLKLARAVRARKLGAVSDEELGRLLTKLVPGNGTDQKAALKMAVDLVTEFQEINPKDSDQVKAVRGKIDEYMSGVGKQAEDAAKRKKDMEKIRQEVLKDGGDVKRADLPFPARESKEF